MPHIGNDIVDLTQSTTRGKSKNIRFLNRVFTPEEQRFILSSPFPDLNLWSCWAAKEASYKAISKAFPAIPAIPRLFPVIMDPGDSESPANTSRRSGRSFFPRSRTGSVLTPGGACWIRIDYRHTYLHCLAFTRAPESLYFFQKVHYLFSSPPRDNSSSESVAVRIAARRHLAGLLSEKFEDLAIPRRTKGSFSSPPQVFRRDRLLDIDISLSHDGFLLAHAFLLQPESASL